MTDSFQQTDQPQSQKPEQGNFQQSSQENTNTQEKDTKSIEHQLQVLQKRFNDTQQFVDTLKDENKSYREEVKSLSEKYNSLSQEASTAADLWERMQSTQSPDNTSQKTELDVEELRRKGFLTAEDLQNQEAERTRQSNLDMAVEAAQKAYGEDWAKVVSTKLKELNMSGEELDALSGHNPKAAIALLGLDKGNKSSQLNTEGTVNTQSLSTENSQPHRRKSLMVGASTRDLSDAVKRIREQINNQ